MYFRRSDGRAAHAAHPPSENKGDKTGSETLGRGEVVSSPVRTPENCRVSGTQAAAAEKAAVTLSPAWLTGEPRHDEAPCLGMQRTGRPSAGKISVVMLTAVDDALRALRTADTEIVLVAVDCWNPVGNGARMFNLAAACLVPAGIKTHNIRR